MRIIGSDYDGTLSFGGITPEKCERIKKFRESGNIFGIVSGRGADFCESLKKYHPSLKFDFFAVCNGGVVIDGDGKLISETHVSGVDTDALFALLREHGCSSYHIRGINGDVFNVTVAVDATENCPENLDPASVTLLADVPRIESFNQISVRCTTVDEAVTVAGYINDQFGELIVPLQNSNWIDVIPHGVNKAEGLYRVMEHFGGRKEDVIAVGDNVNDVDMLREFHSYAMANGVDEIKPLSNGIVSDVLEIFDLIK